VPADGRFAEQAGTVVAPEQDVLVIVPQDREEEVVTRLARIGFDKARGYLLDVRNAAEREEGFVERSLHIPLAELARRVDEIPTSHPLVVHCAGGHRSSIATSLLRHQGRDDVSDLLGGYGAWLAPSASADV